MEPITREQLDSLLNHSKPGRHRQHYRNTCDALARNLSTDELLIDLGASNHPLYDEIVAERMQLFASCDVAKFYLLQLERL